MNKDTVMCTNARCNVKDCPHNVANAKQGATYGFAHLENNPLYCNKNNWNGYQVNGVDLAKEDK